ncbi:SDR family oxidoreductase [Micromonospora zingiberis]|uniref:SDR family oxidoreductase n=1 Tax=Micromonospora zingiberis TaxID=2053011 RepID=A0A4R0FYL8_9ACTN|nr:SDR family oxidoreductase [Micromonospora zingiberis]TCB88746.1 SDR family oxidoreductase [Micromonospora zingiberis]
MPVALITGSSRGIGRAIANKLAADGFDIVVNYHTAAAAAAETVRHVEALDRKAIAVPADVADPRELRTLFQTTEDHFGGIDVFVGNAATATNAAIADTSDDEFDRMWRTNTRATFLGIRESARRMSDGGRIVIISSGAVVALNPGTGPYAATKAAGDTLVQVAAKEMGPHGITVNSVLPGPTRTDMLMVDPDQVAGITPLGRIGEPDDIADVVGFLVSPAGRWITGQTIRAAGGLI